MYKLFSCCQLVSGYCRSLIQDFHRKEVYFIPNDLYTFLGQNKEELTKSKLNDLANSEVGKEYFDFLLDNEIVFNLPETFKLNFPEIDKSYEAPFDFEVLELDSDIAIKHPIILEYIYDLDVRDVLVHFDFLDFNELKEFETLLSSISSPSIILKFKNAKNYEQLGKVNELVNKNPFIRYCILEKSEIDVSSLEYIQTKNKSKFHVGINNSVEFYSLAKSKNPYYFKRLQINSSTNIELLLSNKGVTFKETIKGLSEAGEDIQNLTKDNILVCKDCEFRYLCCDSDIPQKNAYNEWFQSNECPYNPYISKWEGQVGYRNLLECGIQNNKSGFLRDDEKLIDINKELWD
jgi:hypothetical protein